MINYQKEMKQDSSIIFTFVNNYLLLKALVPENANA